MDIVNKRGVKGGNGNEASEMSDIVARAGSFQNGAGASCDAIEAESMEENKSSKQFYFWLGDNGCKTCF